MRAAGADAAGPRAVAQFDAGENLAERFAALRALVHHRARGAAERLAGFHDRWRHDPQVVDKWLALQAGRPGAETLGEVEALTGHPSFDWKNPNKLRSLVGVFATANPTAFHASDGSGYRFLADWLIRLDAVNPQTAARLAGAFEAWKRYTDDRQALMREEMARIAAVDALSKNTREIVERMLEA